MIFYKISIFIVLMGLTIFDVNIREVIGSNEDDPYKIGGKWFVVATSANDSAIFSNFKCWSVTITITSRTTFSGISTHLAGSSTDSVNFEAVKSELYLYPNVFDISVLYPTHEREEYEVDLYENYIQQYSIWQWKTKGMNAGSLIVSRHAELSTAQENTLKGQPHFTKIENKRGGSCSITDDEAGSSVVDSSGDLYGLNGKWYVGAYKPSDMSLPLPRCWTVNIFSVSSSYAGNSGHYVDGDDYEIVRSFSATPSVNWVKIPSIDVSSTDSHGKFKGLKIMPFKSYIYNYSIWVPKEKTVFQYLIVSRYPTFSGEEEKALNGLDNGLFFINNTNYGRCPRYKLETLSTKDSDESGVDDDEPTKMPVRIIVKPSVAHRVSITIPVLLLFFVHLCLH